MKATFVPNWDGVTLLKPGEYAQDPWGNWFACTPEDHLCNLARHTVTITAGLITVNPSILVSVPSTGSTARIELWHGWLEHGEWRTCGRTNAYV